MPLFVVATHAGEDERELQEVIISAIRADLSPRHVPDEIVVAPAIPRTLTGKKLEVPVKRILQGQPPERAAALGSVDEPAALEWYAGFASRRTAGAGAAR
jgi:acetoacetyl-CoA synthetase